MPVPLPFARSYWVEPGRLLAGAYPGDPQPAVTAARVAALLDAGVRLVVNLMEATERDRQGRLFTPYEPELATQAAARGIGARCLRVPIRDLSTPSVGTMQRILQEIGQSLARDEAVYIHCWGGRGRTGTVVGCWLVRQHGLCGTAALDRIVALRAAEPTAHRPSPETPDQVRLVRHWPATLR